MKLLIFKVTQTQGLGLAIIQCCKARRDLALRPNCGRSLDGLLTYSGEVGNVVDQLELLPSNKVIFLS
jgi:hypothetical protein